MEHIEQILNECEIDDKVEYYLLEQYNRKRG